ncbi:MAG: hypothetical protein Q8Q20_05875 [bacterium]|nr:hypothetical protein [bacterium]
MSKPMSITKQVFLILILIFGFAAITAGIGTYYNPAYPDWLGIMVIAIGVLVVVFSVGISIRETVYRQPQTLNPSLTFRKVSRMAYLVLWLALVIRYLPSSTSDDLEPLPYWAIVLVFTAGVVILFYTKHHKEQSLWDVLTLQAQDEREQRIIDAAGRKTYAFTRIVLLIIVLLFLSGLFTTEIRLNAFGLAMIIWAVIFFIHAFFEMQVGDSVAKKG